MSAACSLPLMSEHINVEGLQAEQATWLICLSCKSMELEAAGGSVFPALRILATVLPKPAIARSSTLPEMSRIAPSATRVN